MGYSYISHSFDSTFKLESNLSNLFYFTPVRQFSFLSNIQYCVRILHRVRTVPYRTVPNRTVPNRTVPQRFPKIFTAIALAEKGIFVPFTVPFSVFLRKARSLPSQKLKTFPVYFVDREPYR